VHNPWQQRVVRVQGKDPSPTPVKIPSRERCVNDACRLLVRENSLACLLIHAYLTNVIQSKVRYLMGFEACFSNFAPLTLCGELHRSKTCFFLLLCLRRVDDHEVPREMALVPSAVHYRTSVIRKTVDLT
jgi:hypothetical protein